MGRDRISKRAQLRTHYTNENYTQARSLLRAPGNRRSHPQNPRISELSKQNSFMRSSTLTSTSPSSLSGSGAFGRTQTPSSWWWRTKSAQAGSLTGSCLRTNPTAKCMACPACGSDSETSAVSRFTSWVVEPRLG